MQLWQQTQLYRPRLYGRGRNDWRHGEEDSHHKAERVGPVRPRDNVGGIIGPGMGHQQEGPDGVQTDCGVHGAISLLPTALYILITYCHR